MIIIIEKGEPSEGPGNVNKPLGTSATDGESARALLFSETLEFTGRAFFVIGPNLITYSFDQDKSRHHCAFVGSA